MSNTPTILQNPLTNKDTAFTQEERAKYGLTAACLSSWKRSNNRPRVPTASFHPMKKTLKNISFSINCTTATKCCTTNS